MRRFSLLIVLLAVLLPIGFVSAADWVEVARFEGNRTSIDYTKDGIYTEPFMIDSYGWRINWEYNPDIVGDYFEVYVYRQDEPDDCVAHLTTPQDNGYSTRSGTFPVYNETWRRNIHPEHNNVCRRAIQASRPFPSTNEL